MFPHLLLPLLFLLSPFVTSASPGCDDLLTSLRSAAATGLYTPPTHPDDRQYADHLHSIVQNQFLTICESSFTSSQATDISRYLRNDQSKTNEILISMIGRLLFRRNDVYSPSSRLLTDVTPKVTELRSTLTSILVGKVRVNQIDTVLGSLMDHSPTQGHAALAEKVLELFNYRSLDGSWGGLATLDADADTETLSSSSVGQRARNDVMYSFAVYRSICSSFRTETLEAILKLVQSHTLLRKFLDTILPLTLEKIGRQLRQENLLQPALPISTPDNKPSSPSASSSSANSNNNNNNKPSSGNEKVPTMAEFMKNYKEPTVVSGSGSTKSSKTKATKESSSSANVNPPKGTSSLPETVPSTGTPKEDGPIYGSVPKLVKYDLDNEL